MKKNMVICAPVTSRSGYGEHARDLVHSFIEHDKYDIKIMDVPWGACPRNALKENNIIHKNINDRLLRKPLEKKPDIYVDIRIPHEFQQLGNFNIGITAGIETDVVSGEWIEGCNKMDLIIVPSEHSKKGFIDSVYDAVQQMPNGQQQKVGELNVTKPIEVLFEGSDENIYKPIENVSLDLVDDIPEDFAFLLVGQWCVGGMGKDRKDISKTIKLFYETFGGQKDQPALILKSNGATYSILDREDCIRRIKQVKDMFPKDIKLPNIYLLHGELSANEMNKLYNHSKVKCMVSFTHGEGFGRPLLEASMTGLPIMASNWSGHVDFLDDKNCLLLPGTLEQVPNIVVDNKMIVGDAKWFTVQESYCHKLFEYAFTNIDELKEKSTELMKVNRDKFTLKRMVKELDNIVSKYTENLSSQVSLNLPKLKKVDKPKTDLSKMKLPKLKKMNDGAKV